MAHLRFAIHAMIATLPRLPFGPVSSLRAQRLPAFMRRTSRPSGSSGSHGSPRQQRFVQGTVNQYRQHTPPRRECRRSAPPTPCGPETRGHSHYGSPAHTDQHNRAWHVLVSVSKTSTNIHEQIRNRCKCRQHNVLPEVWATPIGLTQTSSTAGLCAWVARALRTCRSNGRQHVCVCGTQPRLQMYVAHTINSHRSYRVPEPL